MADFVGYRTFQKIRYFLADAFPFLARIGPGESRVASSLDRFPRVASAWERVRRSAIGTTLQRVANTFVIGHYGSDRLDWSKIPRDSAGVLRSTIVVAALLCLLVPLAMTWVWPPLSAEAISGTPGGDVAGWSVVLWLVGVSLGWSALLAGAGAANRGVFVPALALFLYFSAALVGALPKSWWSLLAPAQAALAIVHNESRAAPDERWAKLRAGIAAVLTGVMTAALAIVVIPTAPWFRGRLVLAATAAGAPLGIALWTLGRKLARRAESEPALRLDAIVGALTGMNALLLLSLSLRGGLTAPAGSIHALAIQVTGFLWPLYFFIGAGVVFKVLRQTTTLQRVAEVTLPARLFVPLSLTLLVAATTVAWIKPVLLMPAFPWPGWLLDTADWVFHMTAWVWRSTLLRLSADSLKWVFLAAALLALWALLKRRLTSAAMARILFAVILVAFAVTQYYFQAFGFIRTPRSSAFSLFIFSAFVLWLVHRTTSPYLMTTSPRCSARARIALYGAVLMFVLVPIHARAAMHDRTVTNEIFLYLFFGALNFGLPYYLYLYASRRFKELPLTNRAALGWILIGAAAAVALSVADKVVVAGSVSGAWAAASAQAQALLEGRLVTRTAVFPTTWLVLRGLLTVGALAAVGFVAQRRTPDRQIAPAVRVFAIVGVAAGLACFSNRGLELPLLPQRVTYLLAPLHTAMIVDASLVVRHLSILLPALMLSLSFSGRGDRVRRTAWWVAACILSVGLGLLWPARRPWLHSTGAWFPLAGIGVIALCALALAVRDMLEAARRTDPATESQAVSGPLVLWSELRAAAAGLVVLLCVLAGIRIAAGRTRDIAIAGTQSALRLPVSWTQIVSDSTEGQLRFTRASWSGTHATLSTELQRGVADSTDLGLLRAATALVSAGDIEPMTFERWEQFAPGAFALDFRVKADTDTVPSFGTAAVARMPNGDALLITAMYSSLDAARRWDIARALQALPR